MKTSPEARQAWIRALESVGRIETSPAATLAAIVRDMADRHADAIALASASQVLTYGQLARTLNDYSRWAMHQPLAAGDVVCLLAPNSPEYVAAWLGLTNVGGVVALINTSLTGDALVHAIGVTGSMNILVAHECEDTLIAVRDRLPPAMQVWSIDSSRRFPTARVHSPDDANITRPSPAATDRALLIFTSGTTGLPKAASVSHRRVLEWSYWFAGMLNVSPSDRMYNCLPMYHSVGGVAALGAMLVNRGSVVISKRFSASGFWDEVTSWDCTLFQYIGELCRYLLCAPQHPRETDHHLRLCCGNGLRPDVWQPFQQRFRIPHILEFYAATEGNVSLYNCEGKPGAIGRIPSFLSHRFPITLIRIDPETEEPERNSLGLCIRCQPGEAGEALGKISGHAQDHGRPFEGYLDRDASARKVLRNVFAEGDAWYRTGDLMRMDEAGFFYFVDRLGDTFRWKGENVSTQEVAAIVRQYRGVADAIVYGVDVPGTEGKAGMGALTVGPEFELPGFYPYLADRLPDYARPLFLRICERIPFTDTFKPSKPLFRREGFDPGAIRDPLYVGDRDSQTFIPLDIETYHEIQRGSRRL